MVVSKNWEPVRLGDFAETLKGQGLSRSLLSESGTNPCLLYGELYTRYSRVIGKVFSSTKSEEGIISRIGDVLLPGSTTTVGEDLATASALMVADVRIGGDVNIIRPKSEFIDSRWLAYRLTFCHRREIGALTQGITIHHLYGRDIASLEIPLPSRNEQSVIVEALMSADGAIESVKALIAKKKAIRDSVLYELIVNQGGLKEISFSKDVSLKARIGWQGLTTAEYQVTGDCFLVTGTDLNGGAVNWGSCWQVAQSRYDQDPHIQLRNGDVLVTKDGTIGKVGFVADLPGKATLNSGVFVIRPTSNELLPEYLRYVMFSQLFDRFLNRLTAGSTILHLYQKDFVNFSFCVPDLEQQAHASTILNDLDEELAALSAQKEKLEMIKQGMMQDLLTGKVRLV
jgi:type I restriction enzyme S subunit